MTVTIAAVAIAFICLIVAGALAHHRERYDAFVRFETAAVAVAIFGVAVSVVLGSGWITPAIWVLNSAIQALGVRQARKYRREWLSWQDPHIGHTCNEDCPGWEPYAGGRVR